MADDSNEPPHEYPDLQKLFESIGATFTDIKNLSRLEKAGANAIQTGIVNVIGAVLAVAGQIGALAAETLAKAEDVAGPSFNRLAQAAILDMFGVHVSDLDARRGQGGNAAAADAIGAALLRAFSGQAGGDGTGGGPIEPSDAPAKRFLSAMAQLSLEGWLEGWLVEAFSLGQIETFGELDDTISHVLGLGRASAAVHGPLVRHMIVVPLEWKILKDHRPALLSESLATKQYLRGTWKREELDEELGRQGWSPKRIEAHLNAQRQFLSLAEEMALFRFGARSRAEILQSLRDQGHDEVTAAARLSAAESTRLENVQRDVLPTLLRAFVNRDLPFPELQAHVGDIITDNEERAFYLERANLERDLNVRHLSGAEVRECVKRKILPMTFYRAWLRDAGYPEDEGSALETLLHLEIDDQKTAAEHAKRVAEERAADKAAREDAAKKRAAELEQQHALARRGALSELRRAAVRGLIPIERVREVLAPLYDADTVEIYLAQVETDRTDYREQQQRAEDARKRAETRHIDIGALEAATLAGVLTVDEFRNALRARSLAVDDIDILARTLDVRKGELTAAQAKRREADAAAKARSIDLGRFESLVRHGHRTLAQYDELLRSLKFDDGARAAMRELLEVQIADDTAARTERDAARKRAAVKGVTLEQMRRAVLLGVKSDGDVQRYLVDAGYTSDAQTVLLAELRRDVADADAARRRREAAQAASGPAALPLSRAARAARLGVITPDAYMARLVAAGYTDDDIAIEMDLLLLELADAKAARSGVTPIAPAAAEPRALTLAQLERAVLAGAATLDDYRAAAAAAYAADDVDRLVAVVADELATRDDARGRRTTINGELAARALSLGELESAVKKGLLSVDDFVMQLERWGYGADDAQLLAALVVDELAAAGG